MILFVDDEQRRMAPHLEALELTFEGRRALKRFQGVALEEASEKLESLDLIDSDIIYCDAVNLAKLVLSGYAEKFELVILDVMMPPLDYDKEKAFHGMRTGVLLYEDLRARNEDVPVITLTNDHDEELRRRFENEPHCAFFHKGRCTPSQLCREVERQLSTQM